MPPSELSLDAIRSGNPEAFAPVVALFQRDVWNVVAHFSFERAVAEDLVQQTFISAYFAMDRFRDGADFGAWLRGIARNVALAELRRRTRERTRLDRLREETIVGELRASQIDEERLAALERCLSKLPALSREMLALRYEQGMGCEQIAQTSGRTLDATRKMIQRARRWLQDCLSEEGALA
jgi:RNA polymerase sigma-70 factor (ECF subfamily)